MTIIHLSSFPSLRPKPPNDLLRIGGSHDGGYLISKSAVSKSRYLLSFGLSYDIEFENDFVNFDSNPRIGYMYDASTKPYSPEKIFSVILACIRYVSYRPALNFLSFLKKRKSLLRTGSVFFRTNVSDSPNKSCVTLTQSLLAITETKEKDIFLKIDIEGDEILILPEIVDNLDFFSGIVLEFHRASAFWSMMTSFIESLKEGGMFLDHIHVNNYGNLSPKLLPNVIELSFSRTTLRNESVKRLPIKSIDSPNSPLRSDYEVIF
jgi:hypothetical protein